MLLSSLPPRPSHGASTCPPKPSIAPSARTGSLSRPSAPTLSPTTPGSASTAPTSRPSPAPAAANCRVDRWRPAELGFHRPLVEPCVTISVTRLTDRVHAAAIGMNIEWAPGLLGKPGRVPCTGTCWCSPDTYPGPSSSSDAFASNSPLLLRTASPEGS
jgi:hypothetical protein